MRDVGVKVMPELVALVLGVISLSVGLCAWLGWPVALTIIGALLVVLAVSSAVMGDRAAAAGRREA